MACALWGWATGGGGVPVLQPDRGVVADVSTGGLGPHDLDLHLLGASEASSGSEPHPFGRSVVFAGRGDQLLVGGAERLQIEVRSLDGELLEIHRGPDAELVIDETFLSSYRQARISPSPM